jgi:hypothetical protein
MADTQTDRLDEATTVYTAYLIEAYGFGADDVALPEAYRGNEVDWFGALNEILTELEDYRPDEVRAILTARNPWVEGGGTLLDLLRRGDGGKVRRILRRY